MTDETSRALTAANYLKEFCGEQKDCSECVFFCGYLDRADDWVHGCKIEHGENTAPCEWEV